MRISGTVCCRALADVDKDGRVDRKEFSIAMYLIKQSLHGHELPSTLPSSLQLDPVAVQTVSLLRDWTLSSMFGMPLSTVRPLSTPHGYCLLLSFSVLQQQQQQQQLLLLLLLLNSFSIGLSTNFLINNNNRFTTLYPGLPG